MRNPYSSGMILSSATKIVLIIMTLAFVGLTFVGKVDPKDFVNAQLMLMSFYFGGKATKNGN